MDSPEQIFHKTIGCIIANIIAKEYNGYMAVVFEERNQKYLRNKCLEVAKVTEKLMSHLKIVDKGVSADIEERVKTYSDLIFDITAMDEQQQKRVLNLVRKIKKETL